MAMWKALRFFQPLRRSVLNCQWLDAESWKLKAVF